MVYVRSFLIVVTVISISLATIGVGTLLVIHNSPGEMDEERAFLQDEMTMACALSDAEFGATEEKVMAWNRRLEQYRIRNDSSFIGDLMVPDAWVIFVDWVHIPTEQFCGAYNVGIIDRVGHYVSR